MNDPITKEYFPKLGLERRMKIEQIKAPVPEISDMLEESYQNSSITAEAHEDRKKKDPIYKYFLFVYSSFSQFVKWTNQKKHFAQNKLKSRIHLFLSL
jgi:hypothetical protein